MEFLAMLYTVLLVAICLMMALLLFRSGRPTGGLDEADCEELKDWLEEQLAAQAKEFNARQDAIAQQNYAAIRSVSETLQTAVQSMSTTLGQGRTASSASWSGVCRASSRPTTSRWSSCAAPWSRA